MLDSLSYKYFQVFSLNSLKPDCKLASKGEADLYSFQFEYLNEIDLDFHFLYPEMKIKVTKALPIELEKFKNIHLGCHQCSN